MRRQIFLRGDIGVGESMPGFIDMSVGMTFNVQYDLIGVLLQLTDVLDQSFASL